MQKEIIISPTKTLGGVSRELWEFRELFLFLALRSILIRYKQTALGVAWALLRPLLTLIIFTIVFNKIAKIPSVATIPYALLVYSGVLPWQFFSTLVSESSDSLIANANLVSKIYFPRIIIPISCALSGLIDFLIAAVLFLFLMPFFHVPLQSSLFILPFFVLLTAALALGVGFYFSALNVKYHDFRFVIPFGLQVGLFLSPVGFSLLAVPDKWRLLYAFNPLVGIMEGFRWAIAGPQYPLDLRSVLISLCITGILVVSGFQYFQKNERKFADLI